MNNLVSKICRLCLNLVIDEKFDPLEGSLKMMLSIIIPNVKLELTNNPVLCKDCLSYVQNAFDYKTNFFEVEEIIETKKEKYNIKNPSLSDLMSGKQYRKSSKINYCRTCLVKVESQLFIDMTKKCKQRKDILLLENCLFEMDSNLTSDCKVCLTCFNKLEEIYKFKINSMKTEERIIAYLKENHLESDLKLNLHDIISIKNEQNIETEVQPQVKKECIENISINNSSCDNNLIKRENDELNNYLNGLESEFRDQSNKVETVYYNYEEYNKKDSSGKKVYYCPVKNCSLVSRYKHSIMRHVDKVHKTKNIIKKNIFKCTKCEFTSTKNYIETIKHLLSHVNTDIYKCTRCPYTNYEKSALTRHIFSHVTDQNLKEYRTLDH